MKPGTLEHVNITVSDNKKVADLLSTLFDWHIRWQGSAIDDGHTIHVGAQDSYLAVYTKGAASESDITSYNQKGGLNHVGVVVDDLDTVEERVLNAGFKTYSHGDYEPGKRFYFDGPDDIEFEVISYS